MGTVRRLIVTDDVAVSPVQPHAARKAYLCPGCSGTIAPGTFHLVVVPEHEPDLRRHWHHGCWHKDLRRRNGRTALIQ
jgi:hypothetical protein